MAFFTFTQTNTHTQTHTREWRENAVKRTRTEIEESKDVPKPVVCLFLSWAHLMHPRAIAGLASEQGPGWTPSG